MHQHPLTLEIRPDGASVTIALAGELDLASCPALRACLEQLDRGFVDVRIDASGLAFIDSSGLALLAGARQEVVGRGGNLSVRSLSPHIRQVFRVTGLDTVLVVED